MDIKKRTGSKYYQACFTVGGRLFRFSTKRTNRSDAKRYAEEVYRRELDKVQHPGQTPLTIKQAADHLLATIEPESRKWASQLLNKIVGEGGYSDYPHLPPDQLISEITQEQVERWVAGLKAIGQANATINHVTKMLKRMMVNVPKWGGYAPPNVTIRQLKTKPKLRHLLPGEEERLLKELDPKRPIKNVIDYPHRDPLFQAKQQDQHDLVVLLLDTGMRYGEGVSLTWLDVDVKDWQTIQIHRSKVGNRGYVPMTYRVKEVLQRRYRESGELSRYVFPAYDLKTHRIVGTKHRGHATGGIEKAIDRAGLNEPHLVERYGKFTVHSLRDSFATNLLMGGGSLYLVQKLLGHSTPQMTQKYAHMEQKDAAQQAANILNRRA